MCKGKREALYFIPRILYSFFRKRKVSYPLLREPAFFPDDIGNPDPADSAAEKVALSHQVQSPFGKVIDREREYRSFERGGTGYRAYEQLVVSESPKDNDRPDLHLLPFRDAKRGKEYVPPEIRSHA